MDFGVDSVVASVVDSGVHSAGFSRPGVNLRLRNMLSRIDIQRCSTSPSPCTYNSCLGLQPGCK